MPTSNGRIYIDTTTTPNKGVSLSDVGECIGVGVMDVGTLCTSPRINMWAKYKPFLSPTKGIAEAERSSVSVNYGIAIPTGENVSAISGSNSKIVGYYSGDSYIDTRYNYRTNGWNYNRLTASNIGTGQGKYVARLLDFVNWNNKSLGYYNLAPFPIHSVSQVTSGKQGGQGNDSFVEISLIPRVIDDSEKVDGISIKNLCIAFEDLFSSYRFGFAMVNVQTSEWAACCTKDTIADILDTGTGDLRNIVASINTKNFNYGTDATYYVYPFFTNAAISSSLNAKGCYQVGNIGAYTGTVLSNTSYPVPMFEARECLLYRYNYEQSFTATRNGTDINCTLKLKNKSASTVSFTPFPSSSNNAEVFATTSTSSSSTDARNNMVPGTDTMFRVEDLTSTDQDEWVVYRITLHNVPTSVKYIWYLLGYGGTDIRVQISYKPIPDIEELIPQD